MSGDLTHVARGRSRENGWVQGFRREKSCESLQYAFRRLSGSPAFSIAAMVTLAIAIGATASVFSLVDAVLLRPFPFGEPSRVLLLEESNPGEHLDDFGNSALNWLDWRAQSHSFSMMSLMSDALATVTGPGEPERAEDVSVTPSFFPVTGMVPALGRTLAVDSSGPAEVVISYEYWQTRFGGKPSVLGRTLLIDDKPHVIVGVGPDGWPGTQVGTTQIWTRLSLTGTDLTARDSHAYFAYGRLAPGVSQQAAQRELETIAQRLAAAYPKTNKGWTARTQPILDAWFQNLRPELLTMLAAAGCVLLIGAANLANLFLVRCLARQRETAVRAALGATRARIASESILEAAMLGTIAGVIGLTLAVAGVQLLRSVAPWYLPRLTTATVNGRAVAFCAIASFAALLVFGVIPAWQTSRGQLAEFLKEGGRGTGSAQHSRLQDAFVVLQVAVALVLLTGAGLLGESVERFQHTELGYSPDGVLTGLVTLSKGRYDTQEKQTLFATQAAAALAALPGVEVASTSGAVPGGGAALEGFSIQGDPAPDPSHIPVTTINPASPDYFRVMGITVKRGRGILPLDDGRAPKVGVVDEFLVRHYFGKRDPIGSRLVLTTETSARDTITVVGIAGSVTPLGLKPKDILPMLYIPMPQTELPVNLITVAIRTTGHPERFARVIKRTIFGLDRAAPVSDLKTMNTLTARVRRALTRFSSFLASLFALIALVLGAVGIYSVLAYIVGQRRREIGVRLALGARPGHVINTVLRHALLLTGIGVAVGSFAAWILTRTLASLFQGVSPHDPKIFVGAIVAFGVIAFIAAMVPALRTTRVDPVVALTST